MKKSDRHISKLTWIIVASVIGAIVTVVSTTVFKDRPGVSVWRYDQKSYDIPDADEVSVHIRNTGDLPLKQFRIEFRMQFDGTNGTEALLAEKVKSHGRSCSSVDRRPYTDVSGTTMFLAAYDCELLNPGETMFYEIHYDKSKATASRHLFVEMLLKAEGYTFDRGLFDYVKYPITEKY